VRADPLVLELERRVCDYVARREILVPGERVLLMLSGGADSMAMLALVRALDRRLGLRLSFGVLHVDYGLRGADSTRDREIVERACAEAGIELDVVRLEASLRGPNFQARARDLRYERAQSIAAEHGCRVIVTAHNRDDQAETILYRLAKYASPQALVGMRPREPGAPGRAALARPLLCLGAAEVRAYCAARGIEFGEDVTNVQPIYARNVVRHEILTRLAELNPRVVETLAAGAEIAAAEREVLDAAVADAWSRVAAPPLGDEVAALDLGRLAREPEALRALCLRTLIAGARGADTLVERCEIDGLARLATRRDDAGSVSLAGGWEVVRGGGRLRLRRRAPAHVCAPVTFAPGEAGARFCGRAYRADLVDGALAPPARTAGGTPVKVVARRSAASRGTGESLEAFVGLDAPPSRVLLRHPARGDRFTPFGMAQETTVARFLAAARVPAAVRAAALVLDVDDRVAWVGYESASGERRGRVAQPCRVSESTVCTLHVVEEEG
jgi:tRNA(Ile)-lysidine synthase